MEAIAIRLEAIASNNQAFFFNCFMEGMLAMSGELVAVGSLVAESLLRHLPTVPEGLQALLHYQFDQCDWVCL